MQVLEDLEALTKLLSARAHDAEHTADRLQQEVTAARAAADRASNDHTSSSKQAESSRKEAATAKRVRSVSTTHHESMLVPPFGLGLMQSCDELWTSAHAAKTCICSVCDAQVLVDI